MTTVLDSDGALLGIFTDGDLRRAIDHGVDIRATRIGDIMTRHSKTVRSDMLAAEAMRIMDDNRIGTLVVVDDGRLPAGIVDLKDLLRAGLA